MKKPVTFSLTVLIAISVIVICTLTIILGMTSCNRRDDDVAVTYAEKAPEQQESAVESETETETETQTQTVETEAFTEAETKTIATTKADRSFPDTVENAEAVSDENNTIETITLEINEIFDDYFTACLPWPYYMTYKVYYSIGDSFKSGDVVEATYKEHKQSEDNVMELTAIEVTESDFELQPGMTYKPVIYLYPEKETHVKVWLDYDGVFTKTIPEYKSGWSVTAYPDGHLTDGDGQSYPYLFWEGKGDAEYNLDSGFCVSGQNTGRFLHEKLSYMGLSEKEIKDFTEFWVPHMQKNAYNRICFQQEEYTDTAKLTVSPAPDSMLRVFMVYTPLDGKIDIAPQELSRFERTGFSLVEWGGAIEQ